MQRLHHALRSWKLSIALGVVATQGCTKFASEWDTLDAEVTAEPLATDADWSCVMDGPSNLVGQSQAATPLEYPLRATDFVSGTVPNDLSVRACYRADLGCAMPATDPLGAGADGIVRLPLSAGFSGYLEITSATMVPTLFWFPNELWPPLVELIEPVGVSLLPLQALVAFGASSQIELDPATGVISMNTYDCVGPNAAGVRLELEAAASPAAVPFTFVDGLPIGYQDTSTTAGTAGFANVEPGLVVVRGYQGESPKLVGLETVFVRPSWVTVASLMPQFVQP